VTGPHKRHCLRLGRPLFAILALTLFTSIGAYIVWRVTAARRDGLSRDVVNAVAERDYDKVDKLLAEGADPDARVTSALYSRPGLAAEIASLAQSLVRRHGAGSQRSTPSPTVLLMAIRNGDDALAKLLLARGSSPNLSGNPYMPWRRDSRTLYFWSPRLSSPLIESIRNERFSLTRDLLGRGADVPFKDSDGLTAIDYFGQLAPAVQRRTSLRKALENTRH